MLVGLVTEDDLDREEAALSGKPRTGFGASKSRVSGGSTPGNKAKQKQATPPKANRPQPGPKVADSSPDVSEDESAMSTLSNMQGGGTAQSDLYHTYR